MLPKFYELARHRSQARVGEGRPKSPKLKWRRHPDSNRGIEVLQTSALPLGYAAHQGSIGSNASVHYHSEAWLGVQELFRTSGQHLIPTPSGR